MGEKMPPPPPPPAPSISLHSSFFSSLKQVEKRLKLDNPSQRDALRPPSPRRAPSLPVEISSSSSVEESLSTPMYLHLPQTNTTSSLQESSEPPPEFLSNSSDLKSESNSPNLIDCGQNRPVDDIQRLVQLLGLGDSFEEQELGARSGCNGCEGCESGFYSKIVGLKGPKCGKEVERLNGWIHYFWTGGGEAERLEPLRLAYLLMGKAVFASNGSDHCLEGLEFPSTVEDFLLNDPPA
ncbi:uncharacterized protein LOC111434155 [Cucurbita moschata]|uniref:Uncharacterized protein LOC111434155 n=1 Tax=Cucurbita moschata TaxID=3662 RepID=A0A6J1END4_CUCMO|nr:uncharacterized protein LOC111434155 [Cucurbita moschata]XP_022927256.1 uncharacterized protein LOC111434155 [Cucurbita moschata]